MYDPWQGKGRSSFLGTRGSGDVRLAEELLNSHFLNHLPPYPNLLVSTNISSSLLSQLETPDYLF